MVYIRFKHNQIGMMIEVRNPDSEDWIPIELYKYEEYLDINKAERAYLNYLGSKKIEYEVVREE